MKRLLIATALLFSALTSCTKDNDPGENTYRYNGVMKIDEWNRTYLLNLPPAYYDNDTSHFPLVIGIHGTGGSAAQFERDYHFTEKANAAGFIALYPDGIPSRGPLGVRTWNAGTCCGPALDEQVDDVAFIRTLIDKIQGDFKVDPKRIYIAGMSNGAMLTYRLACTLSDKIAAVAAVSGPLLTTQPCQPARPMPILHIHSALDTKVPYLGGVGMGGYYFPPADSGLQVWAGYNACSTKQVLTDNGQYTLTQWSGCRNEVLMQLYVTADGGHSWPGGDKPREQADPPSTAINANDVIWDFFRQYTLP